MQSSFFSINVRHIALPILFSVAVAGLSSYYLLDVRHVLAGANDCTTASCTWTGTFPSTLGADHTWSSSSLVATFDASDLNYYPGQTVTITGYLPDTATCGNGRNTAVATKFTQNGATTLLTGLGATCAYKGAYVCNSWTVVSTGQQFCKLVGPKGDQESICIDRTKLQCSNMNYYTSATSPSGTTLPFCNAPGNPAANVSWLTEYPHLQSPDAASGSAGGDNPISATISYAGKENVNFYAFPSQAVPAYPWGVCYSQSGSTCANPLSSGAFVYSQQPGGGGDGYKYTFTVPSGAAIGSNQTVSIEMDPWNVAGGETQATYPDRTPVTGTMTYHVIAKPASAKGVCSTTALSCSVGTSVSNFVGSTYDTWTCSGVNGGAPASCSACTNGATNPISCNTCSSTQVLSGGSCVSCGNGGCTNGSCNNGANNPPACNACTPPLVWNGSSCGACSYGGCTNGSCNNGANNPPACNACTSPLIWNGSSCGACSYGGCTNGSCNNGAINPPACNTCSSSQFWNGSSCVACNGGCSNGSCVNGATNPPTCTSKPTISTFTAGSGQIILGQSTTLTWSATGATSCTSASTGFNTGSGSPVSGTSTITPTSSGPNIYQITCTGSGGTTSAWVTVTAFLPTASITVSPTRVLKGNSITISGNAASVTGCAFLKNGVPLAGTTSSNGSHSWAPVSALSDIPASLSVYWVSCSDYPDASKYVLSALQTVNVSTTGFTEF